MADTNRLLALMQPPPSGGGGIGSDYAADHGARFTALKNDFGPLLERLLAMAKAEDVARAAGQRAGQLPSSYQPGERQTDDYIDQRESAGIGRFLPELQGGWWRHSWKMGGKDRLAPPEMPYDPRLPLARPE